ncbi:GAF domain-containing protein [Deinococcus ficus]|uniref:GAF domain-containing protein n=1 Tax=Deinococcus ficus TaxID=317577 RepID=UPI0003B77B3E|nr:GAF domain-containing protein [Deinococcus ficus]
MIEPLPSDEVARLQVLGRYAILDTLPEEAFDRLTRLAARLFGTPTALVTFVDQERQWFKSCFGLDFQETPRNQSFCAHTMQRPQVMVVPDATRDARFRANPLVTEHPGIRFYAGAPLVTRDGFGLGSLCIISPEPRASFSEEDAALLTDLAALVMDELEWRLDRLRLSTELRANAQMLAELKRLSGRAQLFEAVTALAACPLDLTDHMQALGALLERDLGLAALRVDGERGAAWVRDGPRHRANSADPEAADVRLSLGTPGGAARHLSVLRAIPGTFTPQEHALLEAAAQSVQVVFARRQGHELPARLPAPAGRAALDGAVRSSRTAGAGVSVMEFEVQGFTARPGAPAVTDPDGPLRVLGEALRISLGRAAGPYWPGGLRVAFVLPGDTVPEDLGAVMTRAAAVVRSAGFEPQGLRAGPGHIQGSGVAPAAATRADTDRDTPRPAVGDVAFDPERRRVSRGAVSVQLTRPEALLLGLLIAQPERTVPRTDLMAALESPGANPEALVNVHISHLRQKLARLTRGMVVHTVPRHGYVLRLNNPAPASLAVGND